MTHSICFLNTRPAHQSESLTKLLEMHGINVVCCPTMQIAINSLSAHQSKYFENLAQFDAIFITSVNALVSWVNQYPEKFVTQDDQLIPEQYSTGRLDFDIKNFKLKTPPTCPVFAIGEATAKAAQNLGLWVQTLPRKQFDSEDLLKQLKSYLSTPLIPRDFQANGSQTKVALLSGVGGREVIKKTLASWSCQVEEFELYRRQPSDFCQANWQGFIQSERPVLLISSLESWHNLFQQLVEFDSKNQFLSAPAWQRIDKVVVFSQRIAQALVEQGWSTSKLRVVEIQSNQGILDVLKSL